MTSMMEYDICNNGSAVTHLRRRPYAPVSRFRHSSYRIFEQVKSSLAERYLMLITVRQVGLRQTALNKLLHMKSLPGVTNIFKSSFGAAIVKKGSRDQ